MALSEAIHSVCRAMSEVVTECDAYSVFFPTGITFVEIYHPYCSRDADIVVSEYVATHAEGPAAIHSPESLGIVAIGQVLLDAGYLLGGQIDIVGESHFEFGSGEYSHAYIICEIEMVS